MISIFLKFYFIFFKFIFWNCMFALLGVELKQGNLMNFLIIHLSLLFWNERMRSDSGIFYNLVLNRTQTSSKICQYYQVLGDISSTSFISKREIWSLSLTTVVWRLGDLDLSVAVTVKTGLSFEVTDETSLCLSLLGVWVKSLGSVLLLAATPSKYLSDMHFIAWMWWTCYMSAS